MDACEHKTHGWARFGASHRPFTGKGSQGHAWAWGIITFAFRRDHRTATVVTASSTTNHTSHHDRPRLERSRTSQLDRCRDRRRVDRRRRRRLDRHRRDRAARRLNLQLRAGCGADTASTATRSSTAGATADSTATDADGAPGASADCLTRRLDHRHCVRRQDRGLRGRPASISPTCRVLPCAVDASTTPPPPSPPPSRASPTPMPPSQSSPPPPPLRTHLTPRTAHHTPHTSVTPCATRHDIDPSTALRRR